MASREGTADRARHARTWEPVLIFCRLWEEPGLKTSFARLLDGTTVQTDFEEAAFAFALNRLLDRMSKLRVGEWVKTIYRPEWKGLEPNHFYRALDFLAEHKGRLEEALYARVWDLFNLNWIWYCGTPPHTLKAGRRGDSRSMAFPKKRPDRVQIMIGVLASRDGFPIAHEVFPGSTAELDTFRYVVEKGKHQFHLGRVILVADRGMVSEKLPGEIEGAQLEYIVGVRVRKLKAAREALSRSGRYRKVASNLWVKEVIYGGVRYIVCFNPEEKERDRRTRKQAVARLKEKLEAGEVKQLIGNSAYRRYLKINGSQVAIDEHVLQEEARYDGKYVLRTNSSPRPEEVAEAYKSLWQVERAFRELNRVLT